MRKNTTISVKLEFDNLDNVPDELYLARINTLWVEFIKVITRTDAPLLGIPAEAFHGLRVLHSSKINYSDAHHEILSKWLKDADAFAKHKIKPEAYVDAPTD